MTSTEIAHSTSAWLSALPRRIDRDRRRVCEGLDDPTVKMRLAADNEQAIANGVFGSPFIVVDGEPFWDSDRLGDVAHWLAA
jgi:2-hydroxychromene-2-carboxylate isomerase